MNRPKIIKASLSSLTISLIIVFGIFYFYRTRPVYIYQDEVPIMKIGENTSNAKTCVFVWSINSPTFGYSLQHVNILRQHLEMIGAKLILVLNDDNIALNKFIKAQLIRMNLFDLQNYYDKKGALQKKYKITSFPVMLVFNKKGKLANKIEGFVPWSEPERVQSILKLMN